MPTYDEFDDRERERNREYLTDAFARAAVFYAGIDFQPKFFNTPSLAANVTRANGLAMSLRRDIPVLWVVHLPDISSTADIDAMTLSSEVFQNGIIVRHGDKARVKNADSKVYADLFDGLYAQGKDTVIISGGQAEGCVNSAYRRAVSGKKITKPDGSIVRPVGVIAIDATDLTTGLTAVAGTDREHEFLEGLRDRASEVWGSKVILMTTDEIKTCRREGMKRRKNAGPRQQP